MQSDRPFEPTGLTTNKWKKITPSWINLDDLTLVQDKVSITGLKNALKKGRTYSGDPIPHVVIYKNKKYLSDGYHRYVVNLIKGRHIMKVRVYKK